MHPYKTFIFKDYNFDRTQKLLSLHYAIDDKFDFTETYHFDFDFVRDINEDALDRAMQSLFFVAGVSYYKKVLPPAIEIRKGELDIEGAAFLSKTYQRGLGEFFYVNKLDPHTPINFPHTTQKLHMIPPTNSPTNGMLIGLGGGKDSLVSVELLRKDYDVATWSLGHDAQLAPLVKAVGLPHYRVDRTWDRALLKLREQGAFSGHVPISAIFACVGTVVAILTGRRDTVVSNEQSANEPTLWYQGAAINHQYSKSQEFEEDYQHYLLQTLGSDITRYYSFLRPLSELAIGKIFAKVAFEKYKHVFSSCNRAFVHTSDQMSWCGECSKCAFTFLILTPFIPREELEALWHGNNLLLDPGLQKTYRQLLGIEGDKPLDCVGEIKESRAAMRLAQDQYPELAVYEFELPAGYDYQQLFPHSMPEEVFTKLRAE